jgi:hypothetical protein
MQAYKEAIQLGVMTPNEVRNELGMAPIDGGDSMFVGPNMEEKNGGANDEAGIEISNDDDDDQSE